MIVQNKIKKIIMSVCILFMCARTEDTIYYSQVRDRRSDDLHINTLKNHKQDEKYLFDKRSKYKSTSGKRCNALNLSSCELSFEWVTTT